MPDGSRAIAEGDYTAITGIAGLETVGDETRRIVKPRDSGDIAIYGIPHFTSIVVNPNNAGVDEEVTITFQASEILPQHPAVTVNGHAATDETIEQYTYTYTITEADLPGWAVISITGTDGEGVSGTTTRSDALWVNDFTFDDRGNRLTMRDVRGITRYEYDVLGRLTRVTEPDGKWIAYRYDLNNNRVRMTIRLTSLSMCMTKTYLTAAGPMSTEESLSASMTLTAT